jgi:hypothetical protein
VYYTAEALQRAIALANDNRFRSPRDLGHDLQASFPMTETAAVSCASRVLGIIFQQRKKDARWQRKRGRKPLGGENDPSFDNAIRCLEDAGNPAFSW